MAKFIWTTASGTWEVKADDEDRAFRTVIANRMAAGQTPEEAILSFRHNDALYEVDGEVSDAPFEGPLPEVGEDGV